MIPLRVSIVAFWPIATSFACVGNLEHRFELPGLHHLREQRAGEHVLAELQRQVGDHARVTRPHLQRPQHVLLELRHGAQPVDRKSVV